MPLYKVTETRSFQEWYVVEAADEDEARMGTGNIIADGSELGVQSDLEAQTVEEVTEDEAYALAGGR